MSMVWTIGLTCDEKSLDEISPDPDPLVGAVMEKLVHSRLVGGDGVLFVPIGVSLGVAPGPGETGFSPTVGSLRRSRWKRPGVLELKALKD